MEIINAVNTVNKLDFILYESVFNKYIDCHNIMKKFISKITNEKICIGNPNYIDYTKCIEIKNENNTLEIIISKFNDLIYNFNIYININSDFNELTKISNEIYKINVIPLNSINNINDAINIIDNINSIISINEENLINKILDYTEDNTFLLEMIDNNFR